MNQATATEPILLELDETSWEEYIDRTEQWFGNVLMTQTAFRALAEETLEKVEEPHLREYLRDIIETARRHEQKAEELYRLIGREPHAARKLGGNLWAKAREAMADLIGMAGGAKGGWRDLHQLYLASLNSMSAFAAAEQLGLALGMPEIVEVTMAVAREKFSHHRQLQELVADFAPISILYRMDI